MSHIENDTKNNMQPYLSQEALERLIAETEAGPMLYPPKGFKDDILNQIREKKQRIKNRQLFSYSMKVIVATAAALGIILIVPMNLRSQEGKEAVENVGTTVSEQPQNMQSDGSFTSPLNTWLDEYCSQFNEKLNQLFGMEVYY